MPTKDPKDKDIEDLTKAFEKATGMRVITTPPPGQGVTTYAKDEKKEG